MPLTGKQLVDMSVEAWNRAEDKAVMDKYRRLADHYDGTMEGEKYFPRYYQETSERYNKRPKQVLPVAQAAVEVLAGAMVGEGVQVTIGESKSAENKAYQEIQQHNDLDGSNALAMAQVAGVYGWGSERVILVDKDTMEFERVTPLYFQAFYDSGAIGRTVKRINGLTFSTLYDPDSGTALPRDTSVAQADNSVRVEVITKDEWWVLLNGEPQPTDPLDESVRWMPMDDGKNPYGAIPVSLLWNIDHIHQFQGRSDIDPGYLVAEEISRVYSQMLYNLQMMFPTLTLPKAGNTSTPGLPLGLGLGLEYPLDGPAPAWISPPFKVETFMEPLKAMLTLFFSIVHTPASAHGLGTIFGQQSYESGKAKFYEMGSMQKHVSRKRTNFKRFVETRWQNITAVANAPKPYGWGMALDPKATVAVEFLSDVVPVSDEELTERIILKVEKGLMSTIEGMLLDRKWEDTEENRDKLQLVLDEIGQAATKTQAKRPLDQMLEDQLKQTEGIT